MSSIINRFFARSLIFRLSEHEQYVFACEKKNQIFFVFEHSLFQIKEQENLSISSVQWNWISIDVRQKLELEKKNRKNFDAKFN